VPPLEQTLPPRVHDLMGNWLTLASVIGVSAGLLLAGYLLAGLLGVLN
jgi:hypothetical protein